VLCVASRGSDLFVCVLFFLLVKTHLSNVPTHLPLTHLALTHHSSMLSVGVRLSIRYPRTVGRESTLALRKGHQSRCWHGACMNAPSSAAGVGGVVVFLVRVRNLIKEKASQEVGAKVRLGENSR